MSKQLALEFDLFREMDELERRRKELGSGPMLLKLILDALEVNINDEDAVKSILWAYTISSRERRQNIKQSLNYYWTWDPCGRWDGPDKFKGDIDIFVDLSALEKPIKEYGSSFWEGLSLPKWWEKDLKNFLKEWKKQKMKLKKVSS
ncbi:hypothetical protein IID20_01040 [Patescibacteria group bacterium]|nr:hypothetical protein [Patescibacteria group bacterium]